MKAFILVLLLASCAQAQPYTATVIAPPPRGYSDGDTLHVRLHQCLPIQTDSRICGHVRLRIARINAPEMRTDSACERALARKAKDYIDTLAPVGTVLTLYNVQREKYGRPMADVVTKGGVDLGQAMLNSGLVRPYTGKEKIPWCLP